MSDNSARGRPAARLLGGVLVGAAAALLFVLEKRRPLREATQAEPARIMRNLVLGAASMVVVGALEAPVTAPLAKRAAQERRGLVQRLRAPAWLRDGLAVLALDYTIYLWHIATHRVPLLWRFHLVHHIDLDMDTTTALRFHAVDMVLSVPYRAAQVALIGASPRALAVWQSWFFLSVLFHHSNLALPPRWDRRLAWIVTTPGMHAIHHSAVQDQTNSNWSSGLSIWDRLHRTLRLDVPQGSIRIGVPAYRDPAETRIGPSLTMPFRPARDAWMSPGQTPSDQAMTQRGRTKPTARTQSTRRPYQALSTAGGASRRGAKPLIVEARRT